MVFEIEIKILTLFWQLKGCAHASIIFNILILYLTSKFNNFVTSLCQLIFIFCLWFFPILIMFSPNYKLISVFVDIFESRKRIFFLYFCIKVDIFSLLNLNRLQSWVLNRWESLRYRIIIRKSREFVVSLFELISGFILNSFNS